jgi:hypothetical protein
VCARFLSVAMATDETGKPLGLGKVILYGAYRKDT